MIADKWPIEVFLERLYHSKQVQVVVEPWRVESATIIRRLADEFREMGIFFTKPQDTKFIIENMLFCLHNSPEIKKLIAKAQSDELRRQRGRHAG